MSRTLEPIRTAISSGVAPGPVSKFSNPSGAEPAEGEASQPMERCRSSGEAHNEAPSRSRRKQPAKESHPAGPGQARTSRPCSRAYRAVMRAPLCSPASATTTAAARPAMMRLRRGKFPLVTGSPKGNSVTTAPCDAILRDKATREARSSWSRPHPSTATVSVPASKAARWAISSMPRARPETMRMPSRAQWRVRCPQASPPRPVGARVPTTATERGCKSEADPVTNKIGGGVGMCRNGSG